MMLQQPVIKRRPEMAQMTLSPDCHYCSAIKTKPGKGGIMAAAGRIFSCDYRIYLISQPAAPGAVDENYLLFSCPDGTVKLPLSRDSWRSSASAPPWP